MGSHRRTLYSVLGVDPDAPPAVIKAAYRALAKQYHPDGEGRNEGDAARFIELQEAYRVISDEDARAEYDRSVFGSGSSAGNTMADDEGGASIDPDEVWSSLLARFPEIAELHEQLGRYSPALGNRFRLAVATGETDGDFAAFAAGLEKAYFAKYFGDDANVQYLARKLLEAGNRRAARLLNKLVQRGRFRNPKTALRLLSLFQRQLEPRAQNPAPPTAAPHGTGHVGSRARSSRTMGMGIGLSLSIAAVVAGFFLVNLKSPVGSEGGNTPAKPIEEKGHDVAALARDAPAGKEITDRIIGDTVVSGDALPEKLDDAAIIDKATVAGYAAPAKQIDDRILPEADPPADVAPAVPKEPPSSSGSLAELDKEAVEPVPEGNILSASDISQFIARIRECWIISPEAREKNITVRVRIILNLDGSVVGTPQVLNGPGDLLFETSARSAVAAILGCQKYDFLPPAAYETWRDMILNFNPNMFGGEEKRTDAESEQAVAGAQVAESPQAQPPGGGVVPRPRPKPIEVLMMAAVNMKIEPQSMLDKDDDQEAVVRDGAPQPFTGIAGEDPRTDLRSALDSEATVMNRAAKGDYGRQNLMTRGNLFQDITLKRDQVICGAALTLERDAWDPNFPDSVREAQCRGLRVQDCRDRL